MANILFNKAPSKFMSIVSFLAVLAFLPLLLIAMFQTAKLITRATGTKATIIVDAKSSLEPIKTDFYHAFAQGGEEATDMLAPVLAEVKALNPILIRLDHIYDHYDVVSREGGKLIFHFEKLDEAVSTIMTAGAKPLLSLSYMPKAIAKDGVVINPPNDWNEWALVVQKTIEHYSGKGEKNIDKLYFEVWNEPDLDQFGSWKTTGEKNYLTLYQYAANGAASTVNVNTFYLGGPVTTGLYKNWILALVNSGYRVDFLSWHSYLPDPLQFARDQRNLITWLLPYPLFTVKPIIISEFGFTGNKSPLYGTPYAAAYTAAVIRQLISGGPAFAFSFQPKDGPNQEKGDGWGFITHETNGKKPKPRYYLYTYLDVMAGKRVALTGEGTWVTGFASRSGNTLRMLLVNFDRNGTHAENVPITFINLDPGTYTYTERVFLGRTTTMKETIASTSLKKNIPMPALSVIIIELTK